MYTYIYIYIYIVYMYMYNCICMYHSYCLTWGALARQRVDEAAAAARAAGRRGERAGPEEFLIIRNEYDNYNK